MGSQAFFQKKSSLLAQGFRHARGRNTYADAALLHDLVTIEFVDEIGHQTPISNGYHGSMPECKRRIIWLDYCKTIAIALLILWHYPSVWSDGDYELLRTTRYISTFLMPFFFIASGMLHKDESSFMQAMRKCISRLLLPYLAFGLINLVIYCIQFPSIDICISACVQILTGFNCPRCLMPHIVPVRMEIGPLWFVYSLICIKLCLSCLHFIKQWSPPLGLAFYILLPLACVVIICYHEVIRTVIGMRIASSSIGVLFYMFGQYCAPYIKALMDSPRKVVIAYLIPTLVVAAFSSRYCIGWGGTEYMSINACNMGRSVIAFFICGISGAISLVMACRMFPQVQSSVIKIYSNGTLFILGVHWGLYQAIRQILPLGAGLGNAIAYTLLMMMLFYPLLRFAYAYCPILLGFRKQN